MSFNLLSSTPEQVQDTMFVLQKLLMQKHALEKEISVVYNKLYVEIGALPKSENIKLPYCSEILF
jgi:hypothetical protein